ncbi:MAG: hypothetical protein J7L91_00640 [Candidatus Korarchaeota archaeon]|nr:hypothetical protein [Candidatus Korarchaeota archaeon]
MEEKIGVIILVLLMFSLAASIIPVKLKYEKAGGSLWIPGLFTEKGVFKEELPQENITVIMDIGQIDVTTDTDVERPYIRVEGPPPSVESDGRIVRLSAGHLTLYLPERWRGDLSIKLSMGAVMLRDPHLSTLSVNTGIGTVEGIVYCNGDVKIEVGKGNVRLSIGVPENVQVKVGVKSIRGSVYYNGERVEGPLIERTLGHGENTIRVEVDAYSADLDIRAWRD